MSGVDKQCEYSGVSYGYDMYEFSRNLIQIHPKYHSKFDHQKSYMVFFKVDLDMSNMYQHNNVRCYYALYTPDVLGVVDGLYINSTDLRDLTDTVSNINDLVGYDIPISKVIYLDISIMDNTPHNVLIDIINDKINTT